MNIPTVWPKLIVFVALATSSVRSPGFVQGDESAAGSDGGLDQVVVVFKTHFDIGYTDLAGRVVDRYRTSMIDKALGVCEQTRTLPSEHRFVWTVPGWPMAQILWPGQTPERRERLVRAIRAGRLVWHALPATTHTESLDLEDLVRGPVAVTARMSAAPSSRVPHGVALEVTMYNDLPYIDLQWSILPKRRQASFSTDASPCWPVGDVIEFSGNKLSTSRIQYSVRDVEKLREPFRCTIV